jgi:hypothetical protein
MLIRIVLILLIIRFSTEKIKNFLSGKNGFESFQTAGGSSDAASRKAGFWDEYDN